MSLVKDDDHAVLDRKLDQVIRILERLEDRVSALETAMLADMGGKRGD